MATTTNNPEDPQQNNDPLDEYEAFLASLDPAVRATFETHTTKLKSALVSERGVNKESKGALKRLQELEAAEAKRKEAELSELEKVTKTAQKAEAEKAALLSQLTEERVRNAVLAAAAKATFADPQDAYAMIDRDSLVIDDNGKITGVEEAIKALAKAKPYLLAEAVQTTPKYNLNGGDKGKQTQTQITDEAMAAKRARYHGGI